MRQAVHRNMKLLIAMVLFFQVACAANILVVFPSSMKSHHILGSSLAANLAKRGHNITYVSPFPTKDNPNVTQLVVDETRRYSEEHFQNQYMQGALTIFGQIGKKIAGLRSVYVFLDSANIKWLLKSDSKFDLIIQIRGSEALLGLAHHFDVPVILFCPLGGVSMIGNRFANPIPMSYVPSIFQEYSDEMNFLERVMNVVGELIFATIVSPIQSYMSEQILKTYWPEVQSLQEVRNRVHLGFVNSHISTETPRPYVPALVQIGGYHLQEPELLSDDLQSFLDNETNGIIYFSFGTNIKISRFSKEKLNIIMTSLSKIPMTVLMKSDLDTIENKPDNVEIRSWFPQRGVLAHPNVKLFISHGGFGSTTEALFYGVPIICIPFFGDQAKNCRLAERGGYGINLHSADHLTSEGFDAALQKTLFDESFVTNAKLRSDLYRDQEMNPMDRAAYWVNHVIKHKGAKHLRVKGLDLAWYQYYLLDVIGFLVLVVLVSCVIWFYFVRYCFRMVFRLQQKLKTN